MIDARALVLLCASLVLTSGRETIAALDADSTGFFATSARIGAARLAPYRGVALPVPDTDVEATATTNARGEFVMCGLPRGLAVTVRPLRRRANDAPATMMIPSAAAVAEQRMVVEP